MFQLKARLALNCALLTVTIASSYSAASQIKPLPKLEQSNPASAVHLAPYTPPTPETVSSAISRIGNHFHVTIISFAASYPVNLTNLKVLDTDPGRAVAQLASAIDGHVEKVSDALYLIEPNFRVDAPSTPLVPQIRAVVRASYGLAVAFDDFPPTLQAATISQPGGVPLSELNSTAKADIYRIMIEGRPFRQALFGDATQKAASLSFRPELEVNVRCGAVLLGSFDAWEQRDNSSIGWDYNTSIDPTELDRLISAQALATPKNDSIPMSHHFVTLSQGSLRTTDLPKVVQDAGIGLIVDSSVASQSVFVTNGIFESQMLLESICKCLQLRTLRVDDSASSQPQYVLTCPPPGEDQRIANAAIDREIALVWEPLINCIGSSRTSEFSPFPLAQFAQFATIPYDKLTDTQRQSVDQLLTLIPTQLTDQQRHRVIVTLRPGLIAQGRSGSDLTSTIEESVAIFGDSWK